MNDRFRTSAAVVAGVLAGALISTAAGSTDPAGRPRDASVAAGQPAVGDTAPSSTEPVDSDDGEVSNIGTGTGGPTSDGGGRSPMTSPVAPSIPAPDTPAGGQAPEPAPNGADPDGVTGLAELLDALETGSTVGPGVINGVVLTLVGSQALPPPGDEVQAAAIEATTTIGQQISTLSPDALDQLRDLIAPLACANSSMNAGINALAEALDQGSEAFGDALQPFDLTAQQMATFLRGLQSPQPHDC